MDIALVKHTPMGQGRVSGVFKDDRPVSFIFVPAGYKWQVQQKVPTVWCKRFDGSTFEDFAEDVFRDRTTRACVVADFFGAKGRSVQLWNSTRYLEASCRLCRAISDRTIGTEEGDALFRLLFAQTGWILLGPGMTKATEGDPQYVQRNVEGGTTVSNQWVSGIARILALMPEAADGGDSPEATDPSCGEHHEGHICMPRGTMWAWLWHTKCRGRHVHTMHDSAHDPGGYPGRVESETGSAAFACDTLV